MNIIKETSKYKKYLIKSKNSSRHDQMRKNASHTITQFNSNPKDIPNALHITLTDIVEVYNQLLEKDGIKVHVLLNEIKRLCHNNTMLMTQDISEYIELLGKYSNAIEMFTYHNLNSISEIDIAKLFLINDLSNLLIRVEDVVYI